ncbi:MAG: hydrogenase iron-sulfur subunit [Deltaproteobacteria bacterium]|nr:hydrogenase iron-sulfur subunit [Deltaproteobacteria bacterium]
MTTFGRLRSFKNALDCCIRCGYCFEHCPIFKATRWETDSPRGKLVLLYGLLNGELRPGAYAAEKLFECFQCGHCEKACSSGVPVLKVFEAAKSDLFDAGFAPIGTTSTTDGGRCAHCLNCVRMCKHEARSWRGKVETDRRKCASCGSCLDACPAGAIGLGKGYGTSPDELRKSVAGFLSDPQNPDPKAIVFGCSWSSYPGLQTARRAGDDAGAEHRVIVTACTGRIKAITILEAFQLGAWGVLVNRCPETDCGHGGSARTRHRVEALRRAIGQAGIEPARLQSAEIPRGSPKAFTGAVGKFMGEIRPLGPIYPEVMR